MHALQKPATSGRTQAKPARSWSADRRTLGQANVGFWIVASVGLLITQPTLGMEATWQAWASICLLITLVQAPFDLWGGYVLVTRHQHWDLRPGAWFGQWIFGATVSTALLFSCGALLMTALTLFGTLGAFVTATALTTVLVAAQRALAVATGHLHPRTASPRVLRLSDRAGIDPTRISVLESADPSFIGGWVGLPGSDTLVIPQRWVSSLTNDALHAALVRRQVAHKSGRRWRGVLAAAAFNIAGLGVVLTALHGTETGSLTTLVSLMAGTTIWSFLGLLSLPQFSRRAVLEVDRETLSFTSQARLENLIYTLDRDQENESQRTPLTEYIFHPVPTPETRVAAIQASPAPPQLSPYRVTRMALYTGVACGSVLGRSVHCNIGRPNLWVLYPGD